MSRTRQTFITAFALFSLFFGAGNLILPPFLGQMAGSKWPVVLLGFSVSAVVIPIMAIFGHARLQGSILDFAQPVSKPFAVAYALIVYGIAIALPSPRTASVTYEMAVQPYFDFPSLGLSTLYFGLVLLFVLNRSRIMNIIGKYLTPLILLILLAIVVNGLLSPVAPSPGSSLEHAFSAGVLEGYQTFDAIGGVVVGGVIVVSLALQGGLDYREKRRVIARSGLLAGLGLVLVYGGLIALAAHFRPLIQTQSRSELLAGLSTLTLGNTGTAFLAVLVALACFTTAVGVVAGTADFFKELFGGSKTAFLVTAVIGCTIGVLVGQMGVEYIIEVAVPSLMLVYPLTIVLIVLSVMPSRFKRPAVFRWVVVVALVFTLPDFLQAIGDWDLVKRVDRIIPFSDLNLGWVIPALLTLLVTNLVFFVKDRARTS